ncbi:MAG: WG repeat-containing protein [Firmicutes bacterium]|nr:WG repeat-containing protein [Bacillota bacterium]
MRKNTVRFIRIFLPALCAILCLSSCFVFANSGNAANLTLKEKKTGIKADSVYNRSGYGTVSFTAPVTEEGGTFDWYWYGLLGPDGKYVVEPKPMEIYPKYNTVGNEFFITDGVICDADKAYYDLNGKELFDIRIFNSSLTGNTYYLDTRVMPFYGGRGVIMYSVNVNMSGGGQGWTESENSPIYIVDKSGSVIKETYRANDDYEEWYYGGDGFLCRNDFTNGMSFYDFDGNLLIDLRGRGYDPYSGIFANGYAWVRDAGTGFCGFIDTSGREAIPCEYEEVGAFCDGLAVVKRNGKYGYINTANEIVIPIEYDSAYGAGSGLAEVCRNGKHGFVDYENRQVLPFEYDDLSSFEGGVAYGIRNGEIYIIKEGTKGSVPVPVIAGGSAAVIGIGISVIALHRKSKAAAKIAAENINSAGAAGKAAEEAAGSSGLFKPSFGSRTILVSSNDEKLTETLKARSFLKVRECAFEELEKGTEKNEPDLVITDIGSESELASILEIKKEALKDTALGLILTEELLESNKERLEKLKKDGVLTAFVQKGTDPALAMVKLVLPILKPDLDSDASLGNVGKLADVLGIPAVSSLIDAYTSGRDIKETLEKKDGELGIADMADIIGDLASILGFDRAADIAGLARDAKNVSDALGDESGAYEMKKGVKSMKDILEVLSE